MTPNPPFGACGRRPALLPLLLCLLTVACRHVIQDPIPEPLATPKPQYTSTPTASPNTALQRPRSAALAAEPPAVRRGLITAVVTLSTWMLVLMAAALGATGFFLTKRRG